MLQSCGWSLQNVHECARRLQTGIAEMEEHLEAIHSLDFDLPLKATSSNCSSPLSLILYAGLFSLYWQGRFSSLSAKEYMHLFRLGVYFLMKHRGGLPKDMEGYFFLESKCIS